jgi:hypothetical protein
LRAERPEQHHSSVGLSRRERLIEQAFVSFARGDLGPFESLFAPEAQWIGVPGSGWDGETPT